MKSLAEKFVLFAWNPSLKTHWRIPVLKEHDISPVNSTSNLSTLRHLTNHSVISEPGVVEWWQRQRHVSRLRRPFSLPSSMCGPLHLPVFFCWLFQPVFCLFPSLQILLPGSVIVSVNLLASQFQIRSTLNVLWNFHLLYYYYYCYYFLRSWEFFWLHLQAGTCFAAGR